MKKVDTLKEIIAKKNEKINLAKLQVPIEQLKSGIQAFKPTTPFIEAISKPRTISLIAEIKKASPSAGVIREDFNPTEIAKIYQEFGVQAVSVLTEEDFFCGSLAYINEVKALVNLPVLRKDFILEDYQIYESRSSGADAVLLIADLLTKDKLTELISLADSLGLDCLVEVHNEKELKKTLALKIPASPESKNKTKKFVNFAIGINNRDLHTLEIDPKTTERLFPLIPKDKVTVVESGIKNYQDVLFLKILGVSAILVGQALMESPDIGKKIQELMGW